LSQRALSPAQPDSSRNQQQDADSPWRDIPREVDLPEQLPGEPALHDGRAVALGWALASGLLSLLWRALWMLPLLVPYLLLRILWPRPPLVPSPSRLLHILGRIVGEQPPPPGLPGMQRALIALHVLRRGVLAPLRGLAWFLDEAIYGRALARTAILAPLFEVSAARSGSTQIAHYLEDDPQLVAPSSLQTELPYLWLWRILDAVIGRLVSKQTIREQVLRMHPPEFLARHELDPFRTDSFEMQFLHAQLTGIALFLGPQAMVEEEGNARVSPSTESLWRDDFLRYLDAIGKKRLLLERLRPAGRAANTPPPRLFIKGHFLNVVDELALRYPDACFLSLLRDPQKRIQSVINFHRVQPRPPGVRPTPWNWLVPQTLAIEIDYCQREQAWFSRAGGPRRIGIAFDEYVRDLPGTMRRIYQTCLDQPQPSDHVPLTHAERERSRYPIDRSLEQLGIDRAWLDSRLAAYSAWCRHTCLPSA
jgi:hypothetical protein